MSKDKLSASFDMVLEQLTAGGSDEAGAAHPLSSRQAACRLRVTNHLIHGVRAKGRQSIRDDAAYAAGRLNHLYIVEHIAAAKGKTRSGSQGQSCDPKIIVRELGLERAVTRAELGTIRRRFALSHHPDRVRACDRALAARRMALANRLIDEACARLKAAGR